jgi:hypothetical protein
MAWLLLFDENFNHRILNGLELRRPSLDYVTVQETDLRGASDRDVLEWAAAHNRIVVTHDLETFLGFAYDRIAVGELMPGVIAVPQDLSIGHAIDDLVTVTECCDPAEFENQILHLPL